MPSWRTRPRFRGDSEKVFAFRLCRDLGITYAELKAKMSNREFNEWVAFYSYEAKMREEAERKANRKQRR
jgi:hypothetical protein